MVVNKKRVSEEFFSLDKFHEELHTQLLGFFGDDYPKIQQKITDIKTLYSHAHNFPEVPNEINNALIAPFVPSSIDFMTLALLYLTDLKGPKGQIKSAYELGFGDGRNLLLMNSIFEIPKVYGYELNPNLYMWATRNLYPFWHENTVLSRNQEEIIHDSRINNIVLLNQDIQTASFPTAELCYMWPNEEMMRVAIPRIAENTKIAIYHSSEQEFYHLFDELKLGSPFLHLGLCEKDSPSYFIDVFRKPLQKQ
jgi:hypothetical protein